MHDNTKMIELTCLVTLVPHCTYVVSNIIIFRNVLILMKIYIVVLVRLKIQTGIIKSDEYTVISTYVYFWQSKFLCYL